jgi:hypothetical protein
VFDLVRQAVIALVNADFVVQYPNIPIAYDNVSFDRSKPPEMYLDLGINFEGAHRIALSALSPIRDTGTVTLMLNVREGLGTKTSSDVMSWLRPKLSDKNYLNVEFRTASMVSGPTVKGWTKPCLHVPFQLTTT